MRFDPMRLPEEVLGWYKKGVGAWPSLVWAAVEAGMDANAIGNIVFYLHHPERIGYPLQPGETSLIQEWKTHRDYAQAKIVDWVSWGQFKGSGYVIDVQIGDIVGSPS